MPSIQRKFVGKGKFWIAASGGNLRFVGNVDKATFSAKEDTDKVMDYTKGGGGTDGQYAAISEAGLQLSLVDFNADNLAMALLGTATPVVGGTVTAESVVAHLGSLVPLAKAGGSAHVVKNAAATVTYVANTDYIVTGAGLEIPSTSTIADASTIKVDYSYPAQTNIHTLLTSGQEFRVLLDGINDAETGKTHVVEAYRWKPGATSGFDLIGDKLGRLAIQGEILADSTKTGAGVSKYVRMTQVD